MASESLIVASATRPFPGETANGDAWIIHWNDGTCRIALLDGLGHGPDAQAAAEAALAVLDSHPTAGPLEVLPLCHSALHGTRGAVAAIVLVDPAEERIRYAGVGNVEGRLWRPGKEQRLVSYRGVLGATLPTLRLFELPLPPDWLLVLHTDGISPRFVLDETPGFGSAGPHALAESLLACWGRLTDDATVLVVRPH